MKPYYEDDFVTLWHGDCLDVLATVPDASVDAIVTDPPYGLEFMGKEWDSFRGDAWRNSAGMTGTGYTDGGKRLARPSFGGGDTANPTCAICGGRKRGAKKCACLEPDWRVKGKPLDQRDNNAAQMRAFQEWCESWARECLRILKPGGHMLTFGGTRTWHRLACAVEDAGFEMRDSIAWLYGSGFPKSLDVSKAIDKRPGVMRHAEFARHLTEKREAAGLARADVSEAVVGTRTGACWNWEHHQFPEVKWWPALRDLLGLDDATWGPIIAEAERQKVGIRAGSRLAVAPGQGLDRSAVDLAVTKHATPDAERWDGWGTALKPAFEPIVVARKPLAGTVAQNVLTHGTGALNIDATRIETADDLNGGAYAESGGRQQSASLNPSGMNMPGKTVGAEFTQPSGRWPANVILDESQAAALDKQSGTRTSGVLSAHHKRSPKDAGILGAYGSAEGERGFGDSGGASRFFYTTKAPSAERPKANGVAHPTVKPLDLMRWLVRLVSPPGGVVLDPFAGSGTTLEAAIVEGFRCIGIEREADYLPLIDQRIARACPPLDFTEHTA